MKKIITKILQDFDCAYGGDILIGEGRKYLHLSYDEVRILLKGLKKKHRFFVLSGRVKRTMKKDLKVQHAHDAQSILSAEELLTILQEAKRPQDKTERKLTYRLNIANNTKKEMKKVTSPIKDKATRQEKIRFDWHDHYLEGLRIHGNKDDAEAHADEMKRNIMKRI